MHTRNLLGHSLRARRYFAGGGEVVRLVAAVLCAGCLGASAEAGVVRLYWADAASNRVQSARSDGTSVQDVVTGYQAQDVAFDVASDYLYVMTSHDVYRTSLDGSSVRHIYNNMSAARGMALDLVHGKMYLGDTGRNRIVRTNLDGSNSVALIETGLDDPSGIALDVASGKMYWADSGTRRIQRANLDGSQIEDLVTGLQQPYHLDLDLVAGKIYWTDRGADVIRRANLDGSQVETVVATGDLPSGIKLDVAGGRIYWTDSSRQVISSVNFDGSGLVDVVTTADGALLASPAGLSLMSVAVPEPASWILAAVGVAAALVFRRKSAS